MVAGSPFFIPPCDGLLELWSVVPALHSCIWHVIKKTVYPSGVRFGLLLCQDKLVLKNLRSSVTKRLLETLNQIAHR